MVEQQRVQLERRRPGLHRPDKVATAKSEPMQGARSPPSNKGGKQDDATRADYAGPAISTVLILWKNQ